MEILAAQAYMRACNEMGVLHVSARVYALSCEGDCGQDSSAELTRGGFACACMRSYIRAYMRAGRRAGGLHLSLCVCLFLCRRLWPVLVGSANPWRFWLCMHLCANDAGGRLDGHM